jgi:hypothetical protein
MIDNYHHALSEKWNEEKLRIINSADTIDQLLSSNVGETFKNPVKIVCEYPRTAGMISEALKELNDALRPWRERQP